MPQIEWLMCECFKDARWESPPEGGDQWVSFTLFRDDWPKPDLEFWARKAYVAAREAKA